MKIEKLNENKIRITLNMDDLSERNIDYHSFMSNSIESQSIFLDMLDSAQKEVGFNTDDCRIMIEALALRDGRFVLTITKFEYAKEEILSEDNVPKKKTLHIKRKSPTLDTSKTIYSFESFESFCDYCSFLQHSMYNTKISKLAKSCELYKYNSNYYLIFTNINLKSDAVNFICHSITEFAHFIDNSELFEKKITEYGTPIIKKNAIKTCIEHFVQKSMCKK